MVAVAGGASGLVFGTLRGAARSLIAVALFLLTLCILGFWFVASEQLAAEQGKATALSRVVIRPVSAANVRASETIITLGRRELLQNDVPGAAADKHVRIHRFSRGVWKISNASTNRQLLLEYQDGAKFPAARVFVEGTRTALISARTERDQTLTVEALSNGSVRIVQRPQNGAPRVYVLEHQSNRIRLCQEPQGDRCERETVEPVSLFRRAGEAFRHTVVGAEPERTWIRFGGAVTTLKERTAYIAIPDYPYNGLRLVWIPKRGFAFAPGRDRTVRFASGSAAAASFSFYEAAHPVTVTDERGHRRPNLDKKEVLTSFVAGRTRYAVEISADRDTTGSLKIAPQDGVHRSQSEGPGVGGDLEPFTAPNQAYAFTETVPSTAEVWGQVRGRVLRPAVLSYAGAVFLLGTLLACVLVTACRRFATPYRWKPAARDLLRCALAGLAIAAWWTADSLFALPRESASPIPPYAAIIAWGVAVCVIFAAEGSGNHLRLFFALVTAVVAAGSYTLLAMGLSAEELRWSRFHNETVGTIALAAVLIALFNTLPTETLGSVANALARPGGRVGQGLLKSLPISPWLFMIFVAWVILATSWVALGSEVGIPGFGQPSEALKSMFVVIGSSVVALMMRHSFGARLRPSEGQILISVLLLALLLLAQFAAPALSHDFSPFLILALTSMLSLFIAMLLYLCVSWTSRLSSPAEMWAPPFGNMSGGLGRIRSELRRSDGRRRIRQRAGSWLRRQMFPLMALIGVPALVAGLALGYRAAVQEPAALQAYLLDAPEEFRKPARRLLSWIELDLIRFHAADGSQNRVPIVEFPDTGLQVMRSRDSIESAPCRIVPTRFKIEPWLAMMPAAAHDRGQTLVLAMDNLLGKVCSSVRDSELTTVSELSLPQIHNDFIAAWVVQALGRDGAFALALLEFALVSLMLMAAFRIMRWRPGDEDRRAASTFLAGASVGFAVMLFLQFAIAWMNAFGLLPVMGQPMTFVSHGRSHFLFFGVPAILSVVAGLRFMRGEAPRGFAALSPISMRFGFRNLVRRKPAR